MWTSICEKVGRKSEQHREWIKLVTLQEIKVRKDKQAALGNSRTNAAMATAQKEYIAVHREVNRCT